MTTQHVPSTTRTELLEAAYRILLRDGPDHLTLDAVARETGRSKGGVLYHFPSKEALLGGMVEHVLDRFDASIEAEWEAAGDQSAGSWLRAYIAASVKPDPDGPAIGSGLISIVAAHPGLLDIVRERSAQTQDRIAADGVDPALATVVRLAADGLAMDDLFEFAPLEHSLRQSVLATLIAMTRPASA